METFEGLKEGTVITNPIDGEMTVFYSNCFSMNDTKELCFADNTSIWLGCQFNPRDWEVKEQSS